VVDSLFQFFFRYRPIVFEQGEFFFDFSAGIYVAVVLVAAAIALAVITYRQVTSCRFRDRIILLGLRATILGILLLCLFGPVLIVRTALPQQNILAVLLDDSLSMKVADWDNQPRATFIRDKFESSDSLVIKDLADRFLIRTFRFSSTAVRLETEESLTFDGSQTHIGTALDALRQELSGLPVAGIVLVSDGADTGIGELSDSVSALNLENIPVFTVGIGQETATQDIQIDRIGVPRTVLMGSSLLIDVSITHPGYAGETITIDIEDEGLLVGTEQVRLADSGSSTTVQMRAIASEPGPRVFSFRTPLLPGELIAENNSRDVTVNVRDEREKILYFEGEPRFETKFIRRAIDDDQNLQLVVLQRTADNKHLRLNVDGEDELLTGFPKTRDELFAYRGLLLGSIEASAFTGDQLQMIADFVDHRGGGLLMIGGGRTFTEGGYEGTPVAEVLPFMLGHQLDRRELLQLKVAPTKSGRVHAVTQLGFTEEESLEHWNKLPQVTNVNAIGELAAGATALLNGVDEAGIAHPVLVFQRYGRGKSIAFTIQDSWLWQMHASVSLEDQSHENYWRQLLRWLIDGVPHRVDAQVAFDRVEPGEIVVIETTVVDDTYVELNDAVVVAQVISPNGDSFKVPMQWTGKRNGHYLGEFKSVLPGQYDIEITAVRAGDSIGTATTYIRAGSLASEYFDASMKPAVLFRIAEDTGGRFYAPEMISNLAKDIPYAAGGVTTAEKRALWQMPIVLIILLGLICFEWAYRRLVGLA